MLRRDADHQRHRRQHRTALPRSKRVPVCVCSCCCLCCLYCSSSLPSISVGFFFFCHVRFPQLLHLFHRYLGTATEENSASSCFGLTRADTLLLCHKFSLFLFLQKKKKKIQKQIHRGGSVNSSVKSASLINQHKRAMCLFIFTQCTFTLEQRKQQKKQQMLVFLNLK